MHFAALSPEINSGRMYSGPGSESMILAAVTWSELAAQLHNMAADYSSTTSRLEQQCPAPAAKAMSRAAAPQIRWLKTTAVHAENAAAQAKAAANAYESAFAAMVAPPAIARNRTRRTALASANCLGQHSAAIADIDTEYDGMWAQNTGAMYAYAEAAAAAVALTPFTTPPAYPGAAACTWALQAAPDVMSAAYHVMSAIPGALKELSAPSPTTFESSLSAVTPSLSKLNSLTASSDFAIGHLNSMNKAAALRTLFRKPVAVDGVSARFGRGVSLGVLSVPRIWAAAASAAQRLGGDLSRPPRRPASEYGG